MASLETMGETKQISFIANHIDAGISLMHLGEDDPEKFLAEVEQFCQGFMDKVYYFDDEDLENFFSNMDYSYYDDVDWDYDEYYENTEWAEAFPRLLNLSKMYIQSGDISTGFKANELLLSCLSEAISSMGYLGTDEPLEYISMNWYELFLYHYDAIFQYHKNTEQAIAKAFRCWVNFEKAFRNKGEFGDPCTEVFLNKMKDITTVERFIIQEIKGSRDWMLQSRCFELLEHLYVRLRLDFDKVSQAENLVNYNVCFYILVVNGLCEQACWQSAVKAAHKALNHLSAQKPDTIGLFEMAQYQKIRSSIQEKLVDASEALFDFEQALVVAKDMFREKPSFELYKRVRGLAEKVSGDLSFVEFVEELLNKQNSVNMNMLLLEIYSYEGNIQKLLNIALSEEINRNYYDRKYIAQSLIYRGVNGQENIGDELSKYIKSASRLQGITDMLNPICHSTQQTQLLFHGIDLLHGIIAFHIDAANRNRYQKAAYYMCVMRDIFIYLKQEDKFLSYFKDVIKENSRRPALRDEMSIVYGRNVT